MPIQTCIAIVDDDPTVTGALSSLLRSFGHETECFSGAPDLLSRPDLSSFGCVISDIHMPGMDGMALATILREIEPHLPLILMSGRPETGVDMRARAAGAITFIAKPIGLNKLVAALQAALGSET